MSAAPRLAVVIVLVVCLDACSKGPARSADRSRPSAGPAAAGTQAPFWPRFHGPKGDNLSTETGLLKAWPEGGPELAWSTQGLGHGFASVTMAEGMIYTAGNIEEKTVITALDMEGNIVWQADNGEAWTGSSPGTRGTPTIDGDRLYHESPLGRVVCLDAKTGDKTWSMNILEEFGGENIEWALAESVLIDGEHVICCPGGTKASVVALDKKTGKTVWAAEGTGEQTSYATPTLAESGGLRMILTMNAKALIGVDADRGDFLFRHEHLTEYDVNATTPIYHDGHVFISSGYGSGSELLKIAVDGRKASVEPVWQAKELDNHHGGVLLLDGYLYGSSFQGQWVCLEWETGDVMYSEPGVRKGSLTCADGMLYTYSEKRKVGLVEATPTGHGVISQFKLPSGGEGPRGHTRSSAAAASICATAIPCSRTTCGRSRRAPGRDRGGQRGFAGTGSGLGARSLGMGTAERMASLIDWQRVGWLARLVLLALMVYVFLAAIELFKNAVGMIGQDAADRLFSGLENPFAGLAVGILATALVQSSSVTTSMVVALVGSGELELQYAVPIVMGANVGTSITCALVSLGHITRSAEFRRAFAGATAHDIFNLLTVLILFPLELATGYLRYAARWLVGVLPLEGMGGEFHSPVKTAVKWLAGLIETGVERGLGMSQGKWLAGMLAVSAGAMIVAALVVITKNTRVLMADRIEQWLNRVLRRSGLLGLAIGTVITATVQSSSITTSLLVPMFGAGVLTLEAGFPIMLGANIGTTITALLASTVTGPAGLTIAVVHLLFNVSGTLIFFPVKFMRRIPIMLSEKLADLAVRNWIWVVVYLVGVFIVMPVAGILIWKS